MYIYIMYIYIFEGSLEVKLPTIWTDEKQSWAEVRTTFGGSDVASRGRRKGLRTLSKVSKT